MRKVSIYPLFFVFMLSGFSGLIYESIWTHYLKLFLGHAAYAQALVLAIFMGGLALGSWLCSRYSTRWTRVLLGYALAEGLIGLLALAFHPVFDQCLRFSYASVLPHLGAPWQAQAYKWCLSALLILPQSILLGMTFPLMSAGIVRLAPQQPGRVISLLYFTNSLGAVLGVLTSGFLLIRLVGLPGTIRIAGLLNLLLALAMLALVWRREQATPPAAAAAERGNGEAQDGSHRMLLFIALVTGASSFMYEVGWIRMLSLVLGSSTHAFELMLSAFILGLACGSLWIQRGIDRIGKPERYLAYIQVAMGFLALSTLLLYGQTFNVMKWLMQTLEKTPAGYVSFNLDSIAIALGIMLPTTFCAGMTLPLLTAILLQWKRGEGSLGAVYGANTLGAILGVFFAIHIGLPMLGLKGLIAFGATCDVALGVGLLWRYARSERQRPWLVTAIAWVTCMGIVLFGVAFDPYKLASGVYRTGMFLYPQLTEITSYQDGKTASISTYREKASGIVAIATNGKSDAAVGLDPQGQAPPDEPTMILLGALPMAFHPAARTVANIGLGSGLTTQTLLANPDLREVDTIEIEEAVVAAGIHFLPRVRRVYEDPRSRILLDDAKTSFSVQRKHYDIVISEPSNPWVSGVSGLFSEEFYTLVKQHLNAEGLFVQWVQLYEIDNELVLSILKTLSGSFADFAIYSTNDHDMVIVARADGHLPPLDPGLFRHAELAAALHRIDVRSLQDLAVRKIGNKQLFKALLEAPAIPVNSDYVPVLDQQAAKARFLGQNAFEFATLQNGTAPLLEMLAADAPGQQETRVTTTPHLRQSEAGVRAMALRDACLRAREVPPGTRSDDISQLADRLLQLFDAPEAQPDPMARQVALYNGLMIMVPYLSPRELEAVWARLESGKAAARLSGTERSWVALFKAIGRRDAMVMTASADTILQSRQSMPPTVLEFIVATGMTGRLCRGDRAGAYRLWLATQGGIFKGEPPDLLFRILVADCGNY